MDRSVVVPQHRSHATVISILITVILLAAQIEAFAQSPIFEKFQSETQSDDFQALLEGNEVSLDFGNVNTSNNVGIVSVTEEWNQRLQETGSAILGAIYVENSLKRAGVENGIYAVQARRDNQLNLVYWMLLRPNGEEAAGPLQICVERLSETVSVPRAFLTASSPERCCWESDSVRHCGECETPPFLRTPF